MSSQKSFTPTESDANYANDMRIMRTHSKMAASFTRYTRSVVTEGSFTLIELLIVVGILAILVAAVVVTLNPAQLLAQARDSKRQQDLSALNQSLNTITALDQSLFMGTSSIVYTSLPDSTTTCANWNLPSLPSGWQYHCSPTSSLQSATGTGWIPVNFKTTGVVSLSSLPIDPQNTSSTGLYYTYVSGGSFQLASHFESAKYQATQGSDAMYTVGSNTALAPFLSGLVGWWKFDEASGTTTADSSGYNNTGTMYSSTTPTYILTSTGCKSGNCARFDGVNNYVNLAMNLRISDNFSFSGWVNFNNFSGVPEIVSSRNQGNTYDLSFYQSGPHGDIGNGQSWITTSANGVYSFNTATWYYVTSVITKTSYAVYINGNIVGLGNFNSSAPLFTNSNNSILIGAGGSPPSINQILSGFVDDVRIYNRALSASEISALYNATK